MTDNRVVKKLKSEINGLKQELVSERKENHDLKSENAKLKRKLENRNKYFEQVKQIKQDYDELFEEFKKSD